MQNELEILRKELEERRADLLAQLEDESELKQVGESVNPDRADLAQRYSKGERKSAQHERLEETLIKIDGALLRLDDGTYGICKNCGKDITNERLSILPYVKLCINCQRIKEKSYR